MRRDVFRMQTDEAPVGVTGEEPRSETEKGGHENNWGKSTPSIQTHLLDPYGFLQVCNCKKLLSLMCSWF